MDVDLSQIHNLCKINTRLEECFVDENDEYACLLNKHGNLATQLQYLPSVMGNMNKIRSLIPLLGTPISILSHQPMLQEGNLTYHQSYELNPLEEDQSHHGRKTSYAPIESRNHSISQNHTHNPFDESVINEILVG